MKMIALSFLVLLFNHSANAAQTQYIDCRFPNPDSTDHVIVSLKDTQTGTFFYTTGIDDNGDDQNTGKLTLNRSDGAKTEKDFVHFSAIWKTIQDGSAVLVEFHFTMPKDLLFKTSNYFKAGFVSTITDPSIAPLSAHDDLECFSRLY